MRSPNCAARLGTLALGLLLLGAAAPSPFAATVFLRAGEVIKTMPDGKVVTFWGFAQDSSFGAADGTLTVPGPRINVLPGDTTLDVLLDNRLGVPISLVIPGQPNELSYPYGGGGPAVPVVPTWTDGTSGPRGGDATRRVRSFAPETVPNNLALGTGVHYVWNNLRPGTYLYESGTHPSLQVQMGLYGCMTRNAPGSPPPPALGYAYDLVPYDNEAVLLFSEVDPWFHQAVADGTYGQPMPPGGDPRLYPSSAIGYSPQYFLINGAAYPTTNLTWQHPPLATERLLLRFLNASLQTRIPEIPDAYMSLVAEDGSRYTYPKSQYSVVLPAGKTVDALVSGTFAGGHPLLDRRAGVVNHQQAPGGMITQLGVDVPLAPPGVVGNTLRLAQTADGSVLSFHWSDIPMATYYKVFQDAAASTPTFTTLDAMALDGTTGTSMPLPAGDLLFFLVEGSNSVGDGPQR
jgi:FtsP/CotA-like multicopper oxidase with cupredoxin domain